MKKPQPVHTETVCSVCGLDWNRHADKPTLETCIELLCADLEKSRLPVVQRFYSSSAQPNVTNAQSTIWLNPPNPQPPLN